MTDNEIKYNNKKIIADNTTIKENNYDFNFFPQETGIKEFDKALAIAGYSYDPISDLFYSNMNPWQRKYGYCRQYDEAAAPLGMIVDCEPIHFKYNGKKWLIEFWKGQYDYVTGGEIGVYKEELDLNIPDFFCGTFYKSVCDEDRLLMNFTLNKNSKKLFKREGLHWWLTGFKLGEFSKPSELNMDINITLKDDIMCNAFVNGLKKTGYQDKKFKRSGNTISLNFGKPHSQQPITRTHFTDMIIQNKNKIICEKYQEIIKNCKSTSEKIKMLMEEVPDMYKAITNMGPSQNLYKAYDIFKKFYNLG